jgi:acetyl-CoA acetyltransferase
MLPPPKLTIEELRAADARRAALAYVSEAFAEAVLDGIDVDAFADAALGAVFRELIANYGEERAAALAAGLPERIGAGEFSAHAQQ